MSNIYFVAGFAIMLSLSFFIGGLVGFGFIHMLATTLKEIE